MKEKQPNIAFLFEGVGKKNSDKIRLFNEANGNLCDPYIQLADACLNMKLEDYLNGHSEGDDDELLEWILLYACDCALYEGLKKRGLRPIAFVGYSMGLITEMVCAQAISFESGLFLLQEIYRYPRRIKRTNESMAGIIGLSYQAIEEIIEEIDLEDCVQIASENNALCIIISGLTSAVELVMRLAKEREAIKVIKLDVSYAFHSQFARRGMEQLETLVSKVAIEDIKVPIISVFSGENLTESKALRQELIMNMFTPMKWKDAILALDQKGVDLFLDVGLSGDLAQITRAIPIKGECMTYGEYIER